MIIAIDHGNYAIKTVNHSFIAGVSEHTVKPPIADEILEYDGKYWTLTGNRLSYMRDKTQDERYFILTLFAVAKELEKAGSFSPFEQIDLAVGLPPVQSTLCIRINRSALQFVMSVFIRRHMLL